MEIKKTKNKVIASGTGPIKSIDDIFVAAGIASDEWKVKSQKINSWQTAFKGDSGDMEQITNFSVAVELIPNLYERYKDSLSYELNKLKLPKRSKLKVAESGYLAELTITDLHLGKLAWARETGDSYDMGIAIQRFNDAVDYFISNFRHIKPEQIVLVTGSDFFHVDTLANTTTAGTRQDVDGRWQKMFIEGHKLLVSNVLKLSKYAPVKVINIPGNHDFERSFYLGEVLKSYFAKDENVEVDNEPVIRKYIQWGQNLIGFTHGDIPKNEKLPILMASEVPEMWANTKYREFHTGHLHSRNSFAQILSENNAVRVRILPSLSGTDSWHKSMGYSAVKSAEMYLWQKDHGNTHRVSFNL